LRGGRFRPKIAAVTGNEFIRRLKALGKARRVAVELDASRGKGSHQTLY
jgi:mRNA interferase HicA